MSRSGDRFQARASRTAGSVPEPGREIALSKVVEQGHETSRSLATCDTFDTHHIGTGGLADKKARTGYPHTHRVGVLTCDRHPFVADRLAHDRRDHTLPAVPCRAPH